MSSSISLTHRNERRGYNGRRFACGAVQRGKGMTKKTNAKASGGAQGAQKAKNAKTSQNAKNCGSHGAKDCE